MVFLEIPRKTLQSEIDRLDAAAPRAAGLEDFIKGAIYALEWIESGNNPPSELFPALDQSVQ